MASQELIKYVNQLENLIEKNGIKEEYINAYPAVIQTAIKGEKDVEYGLEISKRAKQRIKDFCFEQTQGYTIEDLEVLACENNAQYNILDRYYEVLECEAPYLVDSFFYYIELDEKDPYKRFYFPRRKVLNPVVAAYQKVYDGKLDFLSVSQPKRTGKTTGGLRLAQMMGGGQRSGWKCICGWKGRRSC